MGTQTPRPDDTPGDQESLRRSGPYTDSREPGFINAVWKSMLMFPTVVILAVVALIVILWFLLT